MNFIDKLCCNSQFHQRFMSSCCADFLSTKNYKQKHIKAAKSNFVRKTLLIKCWWNWYQISTCCYCISPCRWWRTLYESISPTCLSEAFTNSDPKIRKRQSSHLFALLGSERIKVAIDSWVADPKKLFSLLTKNFSVFHC